MFAKAYALASEYTFPVIVSLRLYDNSISCIIGAFVIVNDEGWIITVAHLLDTYKSFIQHQKEIAAFESQVKMIKEDQALSDKHKSKKLRNLHPNPKWIKNHSFWWAMNNVLINNFTILEGSDIAIGQLKPFDKAKVKTFPTFKDPTKGMNQGTSLCKLGYPFHEVKSTFDEATNRFNLADGVLPIPRFPIEGIYTREVILGSSKDGKYAIKLLETSSPGLMGQSGGPIFDTNGTIWAIQSRTIHYPLGFNPKIIQNGREVEESQFLNAGLGVHAELLVAVLKDKGITFNLSDY